MNVYDAWPRFSTKPSVLVMDEERIVGGNMAWTVLAGIGVLFGVGYLTLRATGAFDRRRR